LAAKVLYEKLVHKTLMKLTAGGCCKESGTMVIENDNEKTMQSSRKTILMESGKLQ